MTIFDLLFLASFVAAVVTLTVAAISAVRGRGRRALMMLKRLGVAIAIYFCLLLLTSALTPQRYAAIGDEQCSDDWCIAVSGARVDSTGSRVRYDVTLRLSSRALRVAQRERFVAVYLRDDQGRRYDPDADPNAVPFDTLLHAGESIDAVRHFTVPAGTTMEGLVVAREGGGRFPGCCIIGDESSLFHRRTVVRLR